MNPVVYVLLLVVSQTSFVQDLRPFGAPASVFADTNAASTEGKSANAETRQLNVGELRKLPNKAFAPGEYLKFDIIYGFVTAAEAVMKVSDTVMYGRKCLRVDFRLNSKPFFNVFYKVEDRYHTVIDSEGLFPWHFEQHIREGGFQRDFVANFDQLKHVAQTTEGKYTIPPYVQDMMSAFYFARTIDYSNFKPGQKIHLQNFYKDSTYELDVKFRGRQTIEVEAGTFNCVVIEPLAKEGGLFKSEGKVFVWITDDDRKIPIRVSSKIPIGSIDSELTEYHGINGPVDAKVNNQ
ncbi:MAG: DUF3108 domain-containing protein [Ignavibacteriae bacterium]|nr:DUF3108 domain-containing protein [Ignavibacteria bacterium]MBI3363617.1 DUF3108 domain-containing protein [Ignavibacteriota bacterium]